MSALQHSHHSNPSSLARLRKRAFSFLQSLSLSLQTHIFLAFLSSQKPTKKQKSTEKKSRSKKAKKSQMGCSASRPETFFSTTNPIDPTSSSSPSLSSTTKAKSKSPNPVSRTITLPSHFVHHPPLKKGDTHHLVSLTSTTYGSLLLIDSNPNSKDLPFISSSSSSPSKSQECPSPDSVINTWELMAGLDDNFDHPIPAKSFVFDDRRAFSFDSTKKSYINPIKTVTFDGKLGNLCDSNVVEEPVENLTKPIAAKPSSSFVFDNRRAFSFDLTKKFHINPIKTDSFHGKLKTLSDDLSVVEEPVENLTKPLWQHLSEELILADMDPNVASSFRKAESSRQLGFNHNRMKRYTGSGSKISPLLDNKIQLPGTEDRIVIYFTSLRGIRRTYEDCCVVRTIFKGLRVPVDERDISMDSDYRKELQSALDKKTVSLPQVFMKGKYLGGAEEIKQLHEDGELSKLVQDFPVQDPGFVCESCGDARFVPCLNCNGSRKVFAEEEGELKRCLDCNENGLIRCPNCCC